MRATQKALAVLAIAVISACATSGAPPPTQDSKQISTEMLLDAGQLAAGVELEDLSQVDALELNPEMIAFLDKHVGNGIDDYTKLRRLLYAVIGDGSFEVVYDESTRTAQETFRDRRGNCLSFTNMFVAMSRHLGLDAKYQEVMIPPDWSTTDQFFIFSQHINVYIDLNPGIKGMEKVVDFNMPNFRVSYDRQIISDRRARAHYFNNMGVEHMLGGDTPLAFANIRESVREDSLFSPAWVNLGILYRREGYLNYAEAAYLKALDVDKSNLVAMSNLVGLYQQEGRTELAAHYQNRVESHRMGNPYYLYQLARSAFISGDYQSSIDHLKLAIHKNKNEDDFYFLMSLSYLMSGERKAAQRWMKKAEEVTENEADKKKYSSKLDLLLRQDAGGL